MTIKATDTEKNMLWASIPVLFGLQQFCEGIVWLQMRGDLAASSFTILAKDVFLFFALAFWPIWVPLGILIAENHPVRKKFLLFITLAGIFVACYNLYHFRIQDIQPSVVEHSLQYNGQTPFFKKLIYLAVVSLPCFASSLRLLPLFGLLVIISCFSADYIYDYAYTSVWCFLAAILSIFLYVVARVNSALSNSTPPR